MTFSFLIICSRCAFIANVNQSVFSLRASLKCRLLNISEKNVPNECKRENGCKNRLEESLHSDNWNLHRGISPSDTSSCVSNDEDHVNPVDRYRRMTSHSFNNTLVYFPFSSSFPHHPQCCASTSWQWCIILSISLSSAFSICVLVSQYMLSLPLFLSLSFPYLFCVFPSFNPFLSLLVSSPPLSFPAALSLHLSPSFCLS